MKDTAHAATYTYYHLTWARNIPNIKKEGLRSDKEGYVYLCKDNVSPFFMAPCGVAAQLATNISWAIDKPFLVELALISVKLTAEQNDKVEVLDFPFLLAIGA